jgi:hypothetical protein
VALGTNVSIRQHVTLNMLVQVRLLREPERTTERTSEGTFSGVDAKVIIEIVELTEELCAAFEIAFQYF